MPINCNSYSLFMKKVSKSMKTVQLEMLPPTQDAAGLHLMRVHHQISVWKGMVLSPLDWGWIGSPLEPAKSSLPLAPRSVLALILCACKKECVRRCGCWKARLKCSSIFFLIAKANFCRWSSNYNSFSCRIHNPSLLTVFSVQIGIKK